MSGKSKKVEVTVRVLFPLTDLSREIEGDSARKVISPYSIDTQISSSLILLSLKMNSEIKNILENTRVDFFFHHKLKYAQPVKQKY